MNKLIIGLVVIVIILFYINEKTDGMLLSLCNSLPKLIALGIAILAIFFPRDYDKIPEIWQKYNQKNLNRCKKQRRQVNESVKKYIASNQLWKCNKCNQLLNATYEIDHIVPLYKGGSNDKNNLQALCRNCHGSKTLFDRL